MRKLRPSDWEDARRLYEDLTVGGEVGGRAAFESLLAHPGSSVFGLDRAGRVASMATLHVLPNVTYGGRPYGLVENVVTLEAERGKGLGRQVMLALVEAARVLECYKVMLLTGQRRAARGFYEAVGFSADEKWGMIRRL